MKIPVTIITGALGSGKTTFVNHVLTAEHGLKVGVIVNEYGAVGIDGALLETKTEEDFIELPNGCICCTVRSDLIEAAQTLIATGNIDYLMIETSGVAEAVPVAMSFSAPELIDIARIDGIICVVDAENYDENKQRNKTAIEQLEASDIVLLNKADRVEQKDIARITEDIKKHVPNAHIIETVKCNVNLKLLLGVGAFDPDKHLSWNKAEHQHAHDTGVEVVSCTTGPVDSDKAQAFLENLPKTIFRAKGILCIKESEPGLQDELRIVFQKVGAYTELEFTRPWKENENKETKVVFIGTDLRPKELQEQLENCT